MCISLDEIRRSNVKNLNKVSYENNKRHCISDVIYCNDFAQFCTEYDRQGKIKDFDFRCFLVLDFDFSQSDLNLIIEKEGRFRWEKLIFTQERIEFIIKDHFGARFDFCCSLATQFIVGSAPGFIDDSWYSAIQLYSSCFEHADFSYLRTFIMENSKVGVLKLSISKLRNFRFKNNVLDSFCLENVFQQIAQQGLEFNTSIFSKFELSSYKSITEIRVNKCSFLGGSKIQVEGGVDKLDFSNCYLVENTVLDFEKVTVGKCFSLKVDQMPSSLVLPEVEVLTKKVLELPQSVEIFPSCFYPPELTEFELEKIKKEQGWGSIVPSGEEFRLQVENDRKRKNLDKAYKLVKDIGRKIESLSVLEKLLDEKRKGELIQRKIASVGEDCFFCGNKTEVLKEKLGDFAYFCYRDVFGYFINLQKILRALLWVIVVFSLLFFFTPSGLKFSPNSNMSNVEEMFECIYFTIVTLTTLGYGDIQPLGIGKFYAATLACIGLVLTGTVIAVIQRRYSE